MKKEATASTFVFARLAGEWQLGLVKHPRLGRLMLPGGHVEVDETQAEAAVREVAEEAGLHVRLLGRPCAALPVGFPHDSVAMPWVITEQRVVPDNHCAEPHVHVDHQYVAVAEDLRQVSEPVHPFDWYRAADLDDEVIDDTRLLAGELFGRIDRLVSGQVAAWLPLASQHV